MTGPFRALVRRGLGRALSNRTIILGGLLSLLALGVAAAFTASEAIGSASTTHEIGDGLRASGWENTSTITFLVYAIAFVLGANQIAGDLKAGTIFGILARPVSRPLVFLAGWTSAALVLLVLESLRAIPLIALAAWYQQRIDPLHLLGAASVLSGEWLALAALAALGAGLQPAYAVLSALLACAAGGLAFRPTSTGAARLLSNAAGSIVPLVARQSHVVETALVGSTKNYWPVLEVLAYRCTWIVLLLFIGCFLFSRRDLAPRA